MSIKLKFRQLLLIMSLLVFMLISGSPSMANQPSTVSLEAQLSVKSGELEACKMQLSSLRKWLADAVKSAFQLETLKTQIQNYRGDRKSAAFHELLLKKNKAAMDIDLINRVHKSPEEFKQIKLRIENKCNTLENEIIALQTEITKQGGTPVSTVASGFSDSGAVSVSSNTPSSRNTLGLLNDGINASSDFSDQSEQQVNTEEEICSQLMREFNVATGTPGSLERAENLLNQVRQRNCSWYPTGVTVLDNERGRLSSARQQGSAITPRKNFNCKNIFGKYTFTDAGNVLGYGNTFEIIIKKGRRSHGYVVPYFGDFPGWKKN